jgi:hypothetical protein
MRFVTMVMEEWVADSLAEFLERHAGEDVGWQEMAGLLRGGGGMHEVVVKRDATLLDIDGED